MFLRPADIKLITLIKQVNKSDSYNAPAQMNLLVHSRIRRNDFNAGTCGCGSTTGLLKKRRALDRRPLEL